MQNQCVRSIVSVGNDDQPVVDATLHVVGASRHQQIGLRGITLEGDDHRVGIIVPQRGIDDVAANGRRVEWDAGQAHLVFDDERTEYAVVDISCLLWVTPLTDTLHRNLQRRGLRTGRQVFVLEDIIDTRIEIAVYQLGNDLATTRWFIKAKVAFPVHNGM